MTDYLTPEQRSRAMRRVKLKNGPLEYTIQKELRKRALRFSCHCKDLPGSPDIVFRKAKVAIFIEGDFWHGYRLPSWEHKLTRFWKEKLKTNRRRDRNNISKLRYLGWKVIRIWEHQIKGDSTTCIERIIGVLIDR